MAKQDKGLVQPDFSSILDEINDEDVERPLPIPVGTYEACVIGQPRKDVSSQKGTAFLEYAFRLTKAEDDVDLKQLKEAGGLADRTIRNTFWLPDDPKSGAYWRLKSFCDACGVEKGGKLMDRAFSCEGAYVRIYVVHASSKNDKSIVYANVGRIMSIDEE
jgi:hypothetical protein